MARRAKLKVYRTPIGFHDAYVAAPTQKAALEAWGSNANLFARGSAELVTDDDLAREPLAHPGKIIKRRRGSAEEQFAALPKARPKPQRATAKSGERSAPASSTPSTRHRPAKASTPSPPRPSRAGLDRAEGELNDLRARQDRESRELCWREDEIKRERQRLDDAHKRALEIAEHAVVRERDRHSKTLAAWSSRWTDGN